MSNWHQIDAIQVAQNLGTIDFYGLSQEEVNRRLAQFGVNELAERPGKTSWQILWEQFTATTVLVLIVAAVISGILGDYKDTIAILAIVVFNALLGFNQEYRAGMAFAALKKLAVPTVRVCRQGHWEQIIARKLVPGDLILLEAGDLVPADCRLLESINLRVQESAFTGESESVEKNSLPVEGADLALGDRHNMVYMGTVITSGRGRAVVTETGMNTELGKIAHAMQTVEQESTPLQRRLDQLGRKLAIASLGLVAIILVLGWLRGETINVLILTAVSLAVAVIPEGLPAVVTIALAIGSRRMLKRHALIRKLPAVETLGSVTTICSDKTGTLTQNRMTVVVLDVADQHIDLPANPQQPIPLQPALDLLLTAVTLCNNAMLSSRDAVDTANSFGDPTEIALLVAATHFGMQKAQREQEFPRIAELPFDSDRKCMTTIHESRNPDLWGLANYPYIAFTKGAFTILIELCHEVWVNGQIQLLDATWRERIETAHHQLAATGTRVLVVACRLLERLPETIAAAEIEQNLIFIGIVGMIDPIRPEARMAVQTCQQAGIRPVMITGDHPLTAKHIAEELGISNGQVLTGQQLNQLTLSELESRVESVSVYARVSPQQKLKIIEALQDRGHIVSMTGDGVNDAPALKKADIGVAMGITGTDVAKEAADMVLLDDNFATIVAAVEEGRVIYDNIRKFLKYSMTGNASSVWIMLLAPLLAMPLPLLPLQILWINLLADGLLALALSVEPAERNTMQRPPYRPNENIFGRGVGRDIIWVGLLMGVVFLLLGYKYWSTAQASWQTMVFVTLAFSRMSLALGMRSNLDSLFNIGLGSNKPILGAVALTFILQLAVVYIPWLRSLFQTQPLSTRDLVVSLAISTVGFWAIELEKWVIRRWNKNRRGQ
ncbi:cation-translocating P-type ATPase [Fischerella thermalis]|jgi:Ca2+-transporting ATPase|uniref:ATPase, P-type (Transporting), HAD superfamily, subfamily IC n=1 Tax=Fischerella thermalis JSC-11 TaxID=741277 RepID=G6FMY9_9CYAN|nr:cation-translocating P-type ATPase [Fischerella thermalis]EHC19419.1 ATPase, P-type (transporting), HAD superfamily, subfamily IC [Fischerella thermalis JSC-11]PLZ08428.1 ATPase [Fischerella thermalis WC114]PLZ10162.1 ATPase [Fischerella thermalis WC119]PLZ16762.1 ATPase [Fischerella thermalis WC157]PLZ18492.1 ATPase [Fischerella thermalis WC1110]